MNSHDCPSVFNFLLVFNERRSFPNGSQRAEISISRDDFGRARVVQLVEHCSNKAYVACSIHVVSIIFLLWLNMHKFANRYDSELELHQEISDHVLGNSNFHKPANVTIFRDASAQPTWPKTHQRPANKALQS